MYSVYSYDGDDRHLAFEASPKFDHAFDRLMTKPGFICNIHQEPVAVCLGEGVCYVLGIDDKWDMADRYFDTLFNSIPVFGAALLTSIEYGKLLRGIPVDKEACFIDVATGNNLGVITQSDVVTTRTPPRFALDINGLWLMVETITPVTEGGYVLNMKTLDLQDVVCAYNPAV